MLQGGSAIAAIADISYTIDGSALHISSAKTFKDAKSLTFMVVYNAETVTPALEEMKTSYDYTSSSGKEGVAHVTIFLPERVAADELIASLPFAGNAEEITISDATLMFTEGTVDTLAITKQ